MGKEEHYRQLTIEELGQHVEIDYVDGNIAYSDNINCDSPKPSPFKIDAIRMALCLEGTLQVDVNAKTLTLQPYDILCCGPNVMIHNCVPSADFKCTILALSTRIIRQIINPGNNMRDKIFFINQNPLLHIGEEGARIFKQYYELLSARTKAPEMTYRKEIVSSIACAIIYELLAKLDKYCLPSDDTLVRQGDILFKRFIKLLAEMPIKERSVSFYADKLFVSPKYLSTVCKQICGKTAFELINQLVMEDITHLMKYSEKSIKEISDYLEFPNSSFFGKYVKTHTGFSPMEYRRELCQ